MKIDTNSTIAILGGSGKAGRPLVEEALSAGFRVRLLLRRPEALEVKNDRLEIVPGDVRDPASVRRVLQGCSALLSTLGHTKGEAAPMMSAATQNYVTVMEALGIRRCVVVTSLFTTGSESLDEYTQAAADYMQQHYPAFMADRQREFRLLSESHLDWTYVRVPSIVAVPSTGGVGISLNHLPGPQISAVDLARFLIGQLTDRQYVRKAPFVANRTKS